MLSVYKAPTIRTTQHVSQNFSNSDYLAILAELISRLRKVYASFFLASLAIAMMPKSFLSGSFTFQDYSPAIYSLMSLVIDHSVDRMLHNGDVQIIVSSPLTVISACIELALILSFLLNMPLLFYHFYRFVEPGLYRHERILLKKSMIGIGLLFLLGATISYIFVLPVTLGVLTSISIPLLDAGDTPLMLFFTLDSILSMVIWSVLSAGLLYTIPGFIYMFVILEIIEVDYLIKNRKNVILALLIFAAVITPDPTMVSMTIISGPLLVIYEGIIQAGLSSKKSYSSHTLGGRFI
ncbi:MAG: twin-arginine translocase subunit TatC [Candidatus Kariarchaeaceae archaeon]